jgi:hypothetical protein
MIDRLDTYYASGEPKAFGWTFEGTAHSQNGEDVEDPPGESTSAAR